MNDNKLCELLGIRYPIIQGAMTGVTDPKLVSAVSNAGGLGIYATGIDNLNVEKLREVIQEIKRLTKKPFGVNVVLSTPLASSIIDMLCEEDVQVVTTGAGNPAKYIEKLKASGIKVGPVVPSKKVAVKMEAVGADFIVAEGMESGGFIGVATTMALIPQVVDAVSIPVVAAGGIVDGRGMAAAFMLGACGIQMGTRFLLSEECGISNECKYAVAKASLEDAVILGNRLGVSMKNRTLNNKAAQEILSYESSNDANLDTYWDKFVVARMNLATGDADTSLLGLGQGVGLISEVASVKEIIEKTIEQYNHCIIARESL